MCADGGVYLSLELSHRIMFADSLHVIIEEIYHNDAQEDMEQLMSILTNKFVGKTVFLMYNKRQIRITGFAIETEVKLIDHIYCC